jgi:hypothetical protein
MFRQQESRALISTARERVSVAREFMAMEHLLKL